MINSFKIRYFLFLGLIVLTLSCTDKPSEKKSKIKTVTATSSEGFFYIDSVYEKDGKRYAVVDMIEYENKIDSSDHNKQNRIDLPNGYYIINKKVEPKEKIVSDSVTITMQTLNYDEYGNFKFNEKVNFNELMKTYNMPENNRYKHIPFKITFSNDRIISIAEIYIP
ncbi:hypothetical protein MNBD_IGNAVI01-945 [hydrothermal vent metagenome]|uniref:Lipoprotein n=1 Tax=hydrothermal vent metagenome TaxID=652676 RepID=A0A3B1CE34_9ZZZZ